MGDPLAEQGCYPMVSFSIIVVPRQEAVKQGERDPRPATRFRAHSFLSFSFDEAPTTSSPLPPRTSTQPTSIISLYPSLLTSPPFLLSAWNCRRGLDGMLSIFSPQPSSPPSPSTIQTPTQSESDSLEERTSGSISLEVELELKLSRSLCRILSLCRPTAGETLGLEGKVSRLSWSAGR